MKLIIAATDGSEGAERAVAREAELAKFTNAKLLIVNVSQPELSHAYAELPLSVRLGITEGDALEEISHRMLSRASSVAQKHGATDIESVTGGGDPAETLLHLIDSRNADAIVIGRRGLGQLKGLLIGSVSQKLASLARCIVIIVP